jgi:hypothetical protein
MSEMRIYVEYVCFRAVDLGDGPWLLQGPPLASRNNLVAVQGPLCQPPGVHGCRPLLEAETSNVRRIYQTRPVVEDGATATDRIFPARGA